VSNQKQLVTAPLLTRDYQLLLDRLLQLMHEQMGERLLAVCLYGSLARGQGQRGSDVDLFIRPRSGQGFCQGCPRAAPGSA